MAKQEAYPGGVPGYPIGTVAEVQALGVPLRRFFSCSAPVPGQNAGCTFYDECDRPVKEKAGPENYAYRFVKSAEMGGGAREGCAPCFACYQIARQIEAQGGVFAFMGGPGTKFVRRETRLLGQIKADEFKRENPGKTVPQEIRAALYDKDHPDWGVREPLDVEHEVKSFRRPSQNRDLMKERENARIRASLIEDRKRERMEARFGVPKEIDDDADGIEGTDAEGVGVRARPRPARREG